MAAYVRAAKPRVAGLFLLTTLVAMALAGWATPARTVAVLAGVALAVGGAALLNNVLERDLDRRMRRTLARPTATGAVSSRAGTSAGVAAIAAGALLLWLSGGAPSALLALAGAGYYVLVYTLLLKPHVAVSALPGGLAGAAPPLIGWTATGAPWTAELLVLCAVVGLWSAPHFWALALALRGEYLAASIPTPVSSFGEEAARRLIVLFAGSVVALTLAPAAAGLYGPGYAVVALAAGLAFLALALRLLRTRSAESAWLLYKLSGPYLAIVLAAMLFG